MDITDVTDFVSLIGNPVVNVVLIIFIYRLNDKLKSSSDSIDAVKKEIQADGYVKLASLREIKEGIDRSRDYLQGQIADNKAEILRLRNRIEYLERRK